MALNPNDLNTIAPLLKRAVENLGLVLDKAWDYIANDFWRSSVVRYLQDSFEESDVLNAAKKLVEDMLDSGSGGKTYEFSKISYSDILFSSHKGSDGGEHLISQWMSISDYAGLRTPTVIHSNGDTPTPDRLTTEATVGHEGITFTRGIVTDSSGRKLYYISLHSSWIAYGTVYDFRIRDYPHLPNPDGKIYLAWKLPFQKRTRLSYKTLYYRSPDSISIDSYEITSWRFNLISDVHSESYRVGVDFRYTIEYTFYDVHESKHRVISGIANFRDLIRDKELYFPSNETPVRLTFSRTSGSGSAYHIGSDVKNVESIIGGNGSDAMNPSSTRNFLGQGGNGGNGGGGAGAGGVCKQEIVKTSKKAEIDTTQTIGNMVNGTPGAGTEGTPGHSGGLIIYFNRG